MTSVSAILPVYNNVKEALVALRELEKQSYENIEIIVVDDGSTDGTYELLKQYNSSRKLRVYRIEHSGPSRARNFGASKAEGDILFFAEADCLYSPNYVKDAVGKIVSENSEAVCLTGAPLKVRSTIATECIEIENKMQHILLATGKIKPFYAWVFRKETFLSLGGFDESLFQGEDKDLFSRLVSSGYKVSLITGVNWWHIRDQTLAEMSRKWMNRGMSRISFALKNRLFIDIAKKLAPVSLLIAGILLIPLNFVFGISLLVVLFLIFVAKSAMVMRISWNSVNNKKAYIYYPFFVAVRNISSGLGYAAGIISILAKKLVRR